MMAWAGYAAMAVGLVFLILAGVGVARLPDAFQRMHASTKAGSLGASLVVLGAALVEPDIGLFRAGVTIAFLLMTLPVAAQLLGRGAYMSGARLSGLKGDDPLAKVVAREEVPLEERLTVMGPQAPDKL